MDNAAFLEAVQSVLPRAAAQLVPQCEHRRNSSSSTDTGYPCRVWSPPRAAGHGQEPGGVLMTRWPMPFMWIALASSIVAFTGPQPEAPPRESPTDIDSKLTEELGQLEQELREAVLHKEAKALERLVGSDYTARDSEVPQDSLPRAVWMANTLDIPAPESFEQHHHAARKLASDLAVVSLVQSQKGMPRSGGTAREFYLVDFWQERGGNWQIIGRYSSAMGGPSDGPPKRLPGPTDIDLQLTNLLRELEEELGEAALHGFEDAGTMDRLVAPEFTQRVADAPERSLSREAWGQRSGRYKIESLTQQHHAARRLADDIAVVSLLLNQRATVAGRDRSGDFYVVDIWKKHSDRWQLIARYSSPVGKKFDRSRPL
jgi:hypothetical protein